ncbi:uncharacterized protein BDZ99DRAFT_107187 [Mytilinidion resinicola]|uniref:Uncharacterized protein n=1 Tax=Mytilinidion resinicola TaxID=574789 RepID=A0A6A6Y9R4_9PEZI|nr:uncharacterized protein BDZ99DRAFT_107187 [Mytilinidion resinicola]KAF2805556.1 hypothetical protein BDZ99DRAFT_107187 [Mytilinidion resinicola]
MASSIKECPTNACSKKYEKDDIPQPYDLTQPDSIRRCLLTWREVAACYLLTILFITVDVYFPRFPFAQHGSVAVALENLSRQFLDTNRSGLAPLPLLIPLRGRLTVEALYLLIAVLVWRFLVHNYRAGVSAYLTLRITWFTGCFLCIAIPEERTHPVVYWLVPSTSSKLYRKAVKFNARIFMFIVGNGFTHVWMIWQKDVSDFYSCVHPPIHLTEGAH